MNFWGPLGFIFATTSGCFFSEESPQGGLAQKVKISTSRGEITLELDSQKAPKTVANFLAHAKKGGYNQTIFHRVIDDFMIQGGGLNQQMQEVATGPTIHNEATNGLKNLKGTVAMARTPEVHSARAQFFINLKDNPFLDHRSTAPSEYGYAVFGKVIQGMDVVEAIGKVPTHSAKGHANVPKDPVEILSVEAL